MDGYKVLEDLTPECLFKLRDADCPGRTSHTEFICHDEFAAFADQFGMMGAKARADEKKHRQSNLNELLDKGRLSREKLQESTSSPMDLVELHRVMHQPGARKAVVPRVNVMIVASMNVYDVEAMKNNTQGS